MHLAIKANKIWRPAPNRSIVKNTPAGRGRDLRRPASFILFSKKKLGNFHSERLGSGNTVLVDMIQLTIFLISTLMAATTTAAQLPVPKVERWGLYEISLQSSTTYSNPFKEVQLKGRFRSGESELSVEGFYDGERTWKIPADADSHRPMDV